MVRRTRGQSGSAIAGIAVALGLIVSTVYAGYVLSQQRATSRAITVKGFSEQPIVSDFASWTIAVVVRSPSMAEAYDTVEADSQRVVAYLVEAGVEEESIARSAVSIDVRYKQNERGYVTSEVELYELRQRASVESGDVRRIDRLSKQVTALIREGIEVTSEPPRYYFTELEPLKVEMLGRAAADARTRAERIASDGGSRLGDLVSARQGVFQITPAFSSAISSSGMYDTSSIEKTIRAVITASFSLHERAP
ncbi:MAG: SIMPL domain-containing protein [Deltaproteobacteria bacterium]|nr:MAG: SIMPL domain-containing protein [Deltaproteobacteria bacterium]